MGGFRGGSRGPPPAPPAPHTAQKNKAQKKKVSIWLASVPPSEFLEPVP